MTTLRFHRTRLPNGLTVLTERHPPMGVMGRSVSIGIWVKAGTRHESAADAGVSHFLEHMLFKGTRSRSALDIAREVDQIGGEFNAFTAREYTCFHITLLDRDTELGLDILSDVLLNSTFDAGEFEREKKVILQEISMIEETPDELAHDIYFELLYGKHGLGKPILGTENSVRRMRRGDLVRYFRRNYRPDQLIVSVAGNVTHAAVMKKLRSVIRARWPGRKPAARANASLPGNPVPEMKPGAWWVRRPTEQVHLIWGVPGVSHVARDRFAAYLLNVYLGGGMSSSLFQEIREKNGLAYTVYSNLSTNSDSGTFTIYAGTSVNHVPLCLKLIEECVLKLTRDLLSEEELHSTQENLIGSLLLGNDSVEARMSSIARNEIYFGRNVAVGETVKSIQAVTAEDIRRVARKLLLGRERSIFALGPAPSRAVSNKLKAMGIRFETPGRWK